MYTKFETITHDGYSIVDNWTGELHEFKQVKKVSYDEFILVFLSTIPELMHLKGNQLKILMLVWKYSAFNPAGETRGNIFFNDSDFKDAVRASGLELTNSAIDVYISQLCKQEFLIKKCKGKYLLNPKYFFKGTRSDAAKMSLTIEVEPQLPKK